MSILASMNIAQQALVANEAAISVVSNNIANVDTEGYSRQRVVQSPGVNYTPIGGSAENQVYSTTGVSLDSVERYTDSYLLAYYRQQTSDASYLKEAATSAASIEDLMNELKGTGLEAAFSKFYEAAQTLSSYPTDASARQNYIQQAQTVALKFNNISDSLTDLRTSLVGDGATQQALDSSKASTLVTQVNSKLQQLAKVNSDIIKVSSSDMMPNSLLDKRDEIINELSEILPVTITENSNGTINLSINGLDFVNGTELKGTIGITTGDSTTPAVLQFKNEKGEITIGNINNYITSGSLGAVLDMATAGSDGLLTIPDAMGKLDILARGFAEIINDIQTGADATSKPMAIDKDTKLLIDSTENIFESNGGGAITAGNIKVNSDVLNNPFLIAAARVNPSDYQNTAIGNNSNTLLIIQSRTASSPELGNTSPESYIANVVSDVGLKVSTIEDLADSQSSVKTQVKSKLNSATGVNINEELMDLTKYQTAYRASARLYTVCNELLDTLISLGR